MGLFQRINNEKNELIHFETLITEISKQEGITFSEACAIIAREAEDHLDDIPWNFYEPFYLYDYNVVNGFTRGDSFSKQSINFLKNMAFGIDYVEDSNPEFSGVYQRVDGESGWFREFYFKGSEITLSFLDSGVALPPCLEKFRGYAERRLKAKAERLANEKNEQQNKQLSVIELQQEIDRLQNENNKLKQKIPSMLGEFRDDDPLLIAIQLRNAEWLNYDVDDRKTIPSQEALVAQVKQQYKEFDMPDVQARAIEKVACPIKRK
ncbi:Uncharacterised protein [Citrobacter freundii]|uniref:hypothetical protein n=1 Tax=Citrobacter freundii TaxID=546 RepID=UPI000DF0F0C2|nr:hypothetical protein [Citrobacter freundii]MDH1412250.1 SlyX family protein [Citrobacter freundii]STB14554.1 Uncharacterised protein [Citrobacter freundii]HAU5689066.1 hypothetical protein [Citrobacter freundii]